MNIERFFQEQIREQKRAASGSYHKRGKGVKHGINSAFRTPYYFMSNKEKKKLNGEVEISFMYETIIPKEEFFRKSVELQKTMLTRWREIYDNGKIKKELGMNNAYYYDMVEKLGVPKKDRKPREEKGERIKRKAKAIQQTLLDQKELAETPTKNNYIKQEEEISPVVMSLPEIKPLLITNGLHLAYNGDYNAEQLSKIFTKLQLLTDGEENKFHLAISLTERT